VFLSRTAEGSWSIAGKLVAGAKSAPQALKRGQILNALRARVKLVSFPKSRELEFFRKLVKSSPLIRGGFCYRFGSGRRSGTGAQDFTDFLGEILQREWFLQEGGRGAERTLSDDRIFGVSGKIEHADGGTQREQLFGQFAAADARHDDVGDEDIDGLFAGVGDAQAGLAIFVFEDFLTARG